jgi:hypothetical protein
MDGGEFSIRHDATEIRTENIRIDLQTTVVADGDAILLPPRPTTDLEAISNGWLPLCETSVL